MFSRAHKNFFTKKKFKNFSAVSLRFSGPGAGETGSRQNHTKYALGHEAMSVFISVLNTFCDRVAYSI